MERFKPSLNRFYLHTHTHIHVHALTNLKTHLCIGINTHPLNQLNVLKNMCAQVYICISVHMHLSLSIYIYIYICVCVCECVCVCVCVCSHALIYTGYQNTLIQKCMHQWIPFSTYTRRGYIYIYLAYLLIFFNWCDGGGLFFFFFFL